MRRLILTPLILAISWPVLAEGCSTCLELDGYVSPEEVSDTVFKMVGKNARNNAKDSTTIQVKRGVIQTGTAPSFPNGIKCPLIDSEKWAIDYSGKRGRAALHKGIDIVAPKGTPVLAAASGTVIGKFMNEKSRKGIEIVLRHSPEDTGLPFFTYTQYTHLLEMPSLPIGTVVNIGDEIAKIWNTGVMGNRVRRTALHFAVFYSDLPYWTNTGEAFAPKDGYFMDPVSFYKLTGPYESKQVRALPRANKRINVPYQLKDGKRFPSITKRIWPFSCQRKQ